MKLIMLLFALFAFTASAADVTGTWKADVETPNGKSQRTFVFKMDGDKVTGETSSSVSGKSAITDGKLDGDTLTFTTMAHFDGNDIKLKFTGKVKASEISFHVEADGGFAFDYVAKKSS